MVNWMSSTFSLGLKEGVPELCLFLTADWVFKLGFTSDAIDFLLLETSGLDCVENAGCAVPVMECSVKTS